MFNKAIQVGPVLDIHKKGSEMAKKKKRGAPQKACVKCGKMIHARKAVCEHCQTVQPGSASSAAEKKAVAKTKKAVKRPAKKAHRKKGRAPVEMSELRSAAEFISSVGGVARAKQALATAEELAKKFS